jgi:23S rRNA pseudouridine2605 synthase
MANRRPPRPGGKGHPPARGRKPPGRPTRERRGPSPAPAPRTAEDAPEGAHLERLQKVLAHGGVGSRRACEEVILQGRVTVDGQVVRELGTRVDPSRARIEVDGQKIQLERMVYFAVYKPKGYVSTNNDPSGRPRVVDLLPEVPQRVYTVGRLDEMSTGLMLLTNDGELANRLAHPKFGVEKLYRAIVAGTPSREVLDKLTEGVWLAEGKVRAKRVRAVGRKGEATILELVLAEGKNREVRRMLAKLGHKVMSLNRVAVGPITLKGLGVGEYRPLSGHEVDLLRKVAAGIMVSPVRFSERKAKRAPDRPRPSGAPRAGQGRPAGPQAQQPGPAPRRPSRPQAQEGPPPRRPSRAPAQGGGASRGQAGGARRPSPTGQAPGRPPRPEGPPPSQRRAAGGPGPQGAPRRPPRRPEPPQRRIIGLDIEPEPSGPPAPRARRPRPKRQPPRAALGPRRRRPSGEGGEPS